MDKETQRLMQVARELAREFIEMADQNAENNPTGDTMQVVIVEPQKRPYKKFIPNTLEAMQEIVGGHIENVFIGDTNRGARLGLIVNEEGKLHELPFNRRIVNFDSLVGTFFITAYNYQGDNVSLTDGECDKLIKRFTPIEVYI